MKTHSLILNINANENLLTFECGLRPRDRETQLDNEESPKGMEVQSFGAHHSANKLTLF